MTPDQAIQILYSASTLACINKADHLKCERAGDVLKSALRQLSAATPVESEKPKKAKGAKKAKKRKGGAGSPS